MSDRPLVVFDSVWKKFRRGERHDSLRDLIPATFRRGFQRSSPSDLQDQEFWAVKDVSFEVKPGEALGIIGPNGAGKSTVLKLLTRILRPTRGHCELRGRVGALIEVAAGFHQDLTGRENVYLQGSIMGMTNAEIERRFDSIVDFSGVAPFIDTPVKRYSSGMNARLGFAIAAHLDPDVLIIDEVLSVGDASFQARCLDRLNTLKSNGVSLVFVSHNLPAVEVLCRRALLLNAGATLVLGTPRDAIARHLAPQFKDGIGQRASVTRSGDGSVEIRSVKILTQDEHEVSVIPSGATTIFEFVIRCHDEPRDAIIGFSLLSIDRVRLFGENTTVDMPPIHLGAGETVQCRVRFESLALHEGRYYLTVDVQNPVTHATYDAHEASYEFDVEAPNEYNRVGVIGFKTSWSADRLSQGTSIDITPVADLSVG